MTPTKSMGRRIFLVGAASLVLAGCGGLDGIIGPKDGGTIYAVRPIFPPMQGGAKVHWSLAIMRPDVPGGVDSDRVTLTQPDGTTDYYASATYPDRVPSSVQRALLDGFEASGRIDAVAREEDALHADYNLLVEVKDFGAHYAVADGIPTATVTLMVKLVTSHGRKVVASRLFAQTAPATQNSAAATVAGLRQALGAAVTQIVDWTLQAAAPVSPSQAVQPASPGKPAEQLLHDVSRGTGKKGP